MTRVADIAEMLGGPKVLKRDISSDLDLAAMVREGLPASSLTHVLEQMRTWVGSQKAVLAVLGPPRTLERRLNPGAPPLRPAESDRLARVVRLVVRAEEAIGNAEKAHRWLLKPNRALGDEVPLALLDSDAGAVAVERVLGRIEHGVFS